MSPGVAPFGCCCKLLAARWAGDRKIVRRADGGLVRAQPAGPASESRLLPFLVGGCIL